MDFGLSSEQRLLGESVRKVMDRLATPQYVRRLDSEAAYPYELYDAWTEMGLLRMPFPEAHGGLGGTLLDMVIIAEELARKSFDFFTAYGASVFCGLNLLRNGSTEQCARYLPKLLAGEIRMCVSMSEPDAGSDTGAMRSTARRVNETWRINGQKLWSTGAGARDTLINVYVKTDSKAHYREGMSLFLVANDAPGVELRKLELRDLGGIEEIERSSYPTPWSRSMFASELSKPSSLCLGAFDAETGRLVGYLVISRYVDAWHVMNVAVTPERRRQGIASMMMSRLFDLTSGRGRRPPPRSRRRRPRSRSASSCPSRRRPPTRPRASAGRARGRGATTAPAAAVLAPARPAPERRARRSRRPSRRHPCGRRRSASR